MNISILIGKTLISIKQISNDQIIFQTDDGEKYIMCHHSDCCESVTIDDICGDLTDLIGSPIVSCEGVTSDGINPDGVPVKEYQDSFTWTFYKIDTIKGGVTIRWYGESNGYYSESVSFEKID